MPIFFLVRSPTWKTFHWLRCRVMSRGRTGMIPERQKGIKRDQKGGRQGHTSHRRWGWSIGFKASCATCRHQRASAHARHFRCEKVLPWSRNVSCSSAAAPVSEVRDPGKPRLLTSRVFQCCRFGASGIPHAALCNCVAGPPQPRIVVLGSSDTVISRRQNGADHGQRNRHVRSPASKNPRCSCHAHEIKLFPLKTTSQIRPVLQFGPLLPKHSRQDPMWVPWLISPYPKAKPSLIHFPSDVNFFGRDGS